MSTIIENTHQSIGRDDEMVRELIRNKQDLENRQFIDKTLNEFSNLMLWRSNDDYAAWTGRILDALALKLPVMQAVLYTGCFENDKLTALDWIGAFAYDASSRTDRWAAGDGLIGQSAQSQRRFWIQEGVELPEHLVSSGLKVQPAALLVEPLIYNERTEGVLEMSFSKRPDDVGLELVQSLGRMLAANLLAMRNQQEMRRIYSEMQQKSEALAAQEEEMRQNLEEMAATQEELKRTKDEIERRQQQFERIADNVPGMLYQYYIDFQAGTHGFLYASSRSVDILGVPPSFLTEAAQNPLEPHPDQAEEFTRLILESAQNLTPYSWRGRIKHPKRGDYFWAQADSTPKRETETLIIWDGYLHDITAQREKDQAIEEMNQELTAREEEMRQNLEEMQATQEELRRAKDEIERRQQQFTRLSDNVPGMLYQMFMNPETGESTFTYVSPGVLDMLGFTPEDLTSGSATLDIHPEDETEFASAIMESIQKMQSYRWQGRIKHKSENRYVWIHSDSAPYLDSNGQLALDGYLYDITEQKEHAGAMQAAQVELQRAKDEIERRQQQMDRITGNLPGMLFQSVMNAETGDSRFSYVSEGSLELFAVQPEEMMASIEALEVHPDDAIDFAKTIMESVRKMEPYRWTGRIRNRESGEFIWIQSDSTPYLSDNGELVIDGYMFDVTAQREHSELLQTQNEELAARDEELRQNLEEMQATQEELRRAKEEIERRQLSLDRLTGNLPGMLFQMSMDPSTGDSRFTFVSEGSVELFGLKPEELLEDTLAMEVHPDDETDFASTIMHSIQHMEPYRWRGRIRNKKGGDYVLVQSHSAPYMEEGMIILDGYMFDASLQRQESDSSGTRIV